MKNIWIQPLGNIGNRALQYLAAQGIAAHCPGAAIENIQLPEWGLQSPAPEPAFLNALTTGFDGFYIDVAGLGDCLARGAVGSVIIDGYPFHLDNFPSLDTARDMLPALPSGEAAAGFGRDTLVCSIRGGEILSGVHPDYVLLPPAYYRYLTDRTGLKPVFFGQIGDNPYCQALRAAVPDAAFIAGVSPEYDFEMLRRSVNIAISVSTFSWLAAWLSHAEQVFLPIAGLFSPTQLPHMLFLPVADPRYHFTLFPYSKLPDIARFPARFALAQDTLTRLFRPVDAAEVAMMCRRSACLYPPLQRVSGFDPGFYTERYADVADALKQGLRSALQHYFHSGFHEGREPFHLDTAFYADMYPDAAMAIAEGYYADPFHHFLAAGRALGYRPHP